MSINQQLRHPKESLYRSVCMLIGGLIWLSLGVFVLPFLIPLAILLWISEKFFQATIFGNAVHVNEDQCTNINAIVNDVAQQLGVNNIPRVFILNSDGISNALAIKFLSGKYILLFSSLVDLLWEDEKQQDKIRMIIAHELAHYAAGHMNLWISLLIKPAMLVPFLGAAYSRACELTADRVAADCVKNQKAAVDAMITLASGSRALLPQTNKEAFIKQELLVPGFFGFLQEILSTHPRMTKRIIAIDSFYANSHSTTHSTISQPAYNQAELSDNMVTNVQNS